MSKHLHYTDRYKTTRRVCFCMCISVSSFIISKSTKLNVVSPSHQHPAVSCLSFLIHHESEPHLHHSYIINLSLISDNHSVKMDGWTDRDKLSLLSLNSLSLTLKCTRRTPEHLGVVFSCRFWSRHIYLCVISGNTPPCYHWLQMYGE